MYCDKKSVNILTSVLRNHDVHCAIVCPGSRNAPIVHDLYEAGFGCVPVTDERSAGFQALGASISLGYIPVVVCVTSGSALLNLYPAVAEAYYQHVPLVVIAADRPAQWIGQLDGQTLPQSDAFGRMVLKSVTLPEVVEGEQEEEMHWYCNRLVNEALVTAMGRTKGPVLINIPISEPLYSFTVPDLPVERVFRSVDLNTSWSEFPQNLLEAFEFSKHPLVVLGQLDNTVDYARLFTDLRACAIVCEPLALQHLFQTGDSLGEMELECLVKGVFYHSRFENILAKAERNKYFRPDLVIYIGGHIVSKRLKQYLRTLRDVEQIRVTTDNDMADTFMNLTKVVNATPMEFLAVVRQASFDKCMDHDEASWTRYCKRWFEAQMKSGNLIQKTKLKFSSAAAVKCFHEVLAKHEPIDFWGQDIFGDGMPVDFMGFLPWFTSAVCYGNSSAVRLGCFFADRHIYCNRGVNGIEGSLSTAVGMADVWDYEVHEDTHVYCILGDLSFFYDQNALWNQNLNGVLRIMVLNNGGGAIFGKFEGLQKGDVRDKMVMAKHNTSAKSICEANNITYLSARDMDALQSGVEQLITAKSDRPMLLEVFTDIDVDNQMMEKLSKSI